MQGSSASPLGGPGERDLLAESFGRSTQLWSQHERAKTSQAVSPSVFMAVPPSRSHWPPGAIPPANGLYRKLSPGAFHAVRDRIDLGGVLIDRTCIVQTALLFAHSWPTVVRI